MGSVHIDEFIVPNTTDNIYDFLKPFQKKYPVVIAYWKMFGISGILNRNLSGLVTKDLTVCWNKYTDVGKKFLILPFALIKMISTMGFCIIIRGEKNDIAIPPVNIFVKMGNFVNNPIPRYADAHIFHCRLIIISLRLTRSICRRRQKEMFIIKLIHMMRYVFMSIK